MINKIINRFFRNTSILKIWCVFYSIILLVVVIADFCLINNVDHQIIAEFQNTNKYFLENVGLFFDSVLQETDALKNEICTNSQAHDFVKYEKLDEQARFDAANIVDVFGGMLKNCSYVTDFICYYPESEVIITSDKFSTNEIYYNLNIKDSGNIYGKWLDELKNSEQQTFNYRKIKNGADSSYDAVEITHPIYDKYNNIKFILRFYIKNDILSSYMENDNDNENKDAILILDNLDRTCFSSDGKKYDLSNIFFNKEYEIKSHKYENDKIYISYIDSANYRYKYVYITKTNLISKKSLGIVVVGIISCVMCLACLLVVMWAINRWNGSKISDIVNQLDIENDAEKYNEYQLIKNSIDKFSKNNQLLQTKVDKQFSIIKNKFLADFLKGNVIYTDISKNIKSYDITFNDKYFFVANIFVKNYGQLGEDSKEYTLFAINNIYNDISNNKYEKNTLVVEIDGMLVYIINCEAEDDAQQEELIKILEQVNSFVNEALDISFIVGISDFSNSFDGVPELFDQTVTAIGYAHFYDLDEFVRYREVEHNDSDINIYSNAVSVENEMLIAVKSGEKEKAKNLISDVFAVTDNMYIGKWYYEGLMYNILNNIIVMAKNHSKEEYVQVEALAGEIKKNMTISDMKAILNKAVDIVCNESIENENDDIYLRAKKYVDEHFDDVSLDISKIGNELNMTPFYISRIFKQNSGIKLGTYINSLRIERAKRLLIEDKYMKVNEVAESVGFDNIRTFFKVFKEFENMTPSQYRTINK